MRIASVLNELWDGTVQKDVAATLTEAGLPTDQTKVSAWLRGRVPNVEQMNVIETAFGKPRGWVMARAGFVDVAALAVSLGDDELIDRLETQLEQLRTARAKLDARAPRSTRTRRPQ